MRMKRNVREREYNEKKEDLMVENETMMEKRCWDLKREVEVAVRIKREGGKEDVRE